ncbi:MAG: hypothetical protein AAGC77_09210 [Pseudomonadota bacterium]
MSSAKGADASGAFSRQTIVVLIVVGVFSFFSFIVLSAYAPVLRYDSDGKGHALSKSAIGYGFLGALLEETGVPVVVPRSATFEARDGVIVYTPSTVSQMNELAVLDEYQITIIIIPKWETAPDPARAGWVRRQGVMTLTPLALTLGDIEVSLEFIRRGDRSEVIVEAADATGGAIIHAIPSRSIGEIEYLQYLKPNDSLEPILTASNGDVLFAKVKDQPLYIISDADLANTHGLRNVERATLTSNFFDYARAGGPIFFDLSLYGIERTRNIIRLALEPPFLAASLCALLSVLLLTFKSAALFGPRHALIRPFDAGKAALADNSAALIRMAKRESVFGARYAEMTRRRIAQSIGAPKSLSAHDLDMLINKIAQERANEDFSMLAEQARSAQGAGGLVRAAQKLYLFKKEITRDHR